MYNKVVCKYRAHKEDPNQILITIGGNRICHPGEVGTTTGSIKLVNLIINSVLSRRHARFVDFNVSNFYLALPMNQRELVRIRLEDIPQEFIYEYNLTPYAHKGWI